MRTPSLIILMVSMLFTGCPEEDPPIIPPPPATQCEYPAGNRNYSWRLDTVAWFPSTLGGIHAFSDSDAYLMGYIGEGKAPWRIFAGKHWDGTQWSTNLNGTNAEIAHVANDVTGDDHFMVSVGNWSINPPKPALGEFNNQTKKWKGYQFETTGELRSVWTDGKGYFIAVGDNGMVYIKDGYSSSWVYQKAPTEFGLYDVNGISKHEIYISAAQNLITGEHYTQGWKLEQGEWHKLYDTKDITNTPFQITNNDYPNQMGVWRCNITDSLKLIVHGDQSYLFESKGQELKFKKTNLSSLGLPLKSSGRTGTRVNIFTPNDIWFYGTRYNFYHWNGTNYQKMIIPGLPNDDMQFGWQLRPIKTTSGKLFFGSEISSQVYVVIQGTPQ
ncbi:MAG: hypothetical protein HUU02_03585 [Bacteroidetes bacterium]|nr:hypothetical protein [Bacteroidota bacterium]